MEIKWIYRVFLILSALCFLIAVFSRVLFSSWDLPGLFFLGASAVLFALAVIFGRKSFLRLWTARATRQGFSLGVVMLATLVALVGVNYVGSFLPAKIDFTKQKSHTLSEYSKKVVKSFKDDLQLVYLQIPDENSKSADEAVRLSFQKYIDENPKVRLSKYNLMDHPELTKKYKLNDQEQAMFVVYNDHIERFYKTDENSITQALLRILKGRKTLYFSIGHNELTMDNTNPRGISSLKNEVERLFYDTQEINLEKEVIPQNAAAIIVMAPETKLSDDFKKKIFGFFKSGGRVFIAFDPVQNPDENDFLGDYGLKMSAGVVHQEQNALANVGSFVVSGFIPEESQHVIVKSMGRESPVMFYVSGSLSELMPHEYKISPLMVSTKSSVLRNGFTKQDKELGRGSYVLFSAVENDKGGVLLASADSDIFANQFLYQHMNPSFMFSVFSFLTRDEDVVPAPDMSRVAKDFLVTDTSFKLYVGLFAIPLPLFFLVMSGFWWIRRRWL